MLIKNITGMYEVPTSGEAGRWLPFMNISSRLDKFLYGLENK